MTQKIEHTGMTTSWYVEAINRAITDGCRIQPQTKINAQRKQVFVSSGSDADIYYIVTRDSCTCDGHLHAGRCKHRALAISHFNNIIADRARAKQPKKAPMTIEELAALTGVSPRELIRGMQFEYEDQQATLRRRQPA